MMEFYFYSEKQIHNTIKEMFINFKSHTLTLEKIRKNNFTNQNILLFISGDLLEDIKSTFFLNNNVVVCYLSKNNFFNAKVFNKHININKFIDEVITLFVRNSINYEDIKILEEKIINRETEKEISLTTLEKNILMQLIDKKKTDKNFILENVLMLKKDTQTKTIESHLTRIRIKLSKIDSKLKILSKGDNIFLEF